MALIQFVAMRLADAMYHFDLKRDDRHRGPGLRQQFKCAVEYGMVQDAAIQLGFVRTGAPARRSGCRNRQRDSGFAQCGDIVFGRPGFAIGKAEARFEIFQEGLFLYAHPAIGFTYAKRGFIGQLP